MIFAALWTAASGCAWLRPGDSAAEAESRRLADQARAVAEQGDLVQARELLDRAVSANPDDAELHRERARLLMHEGNCRSAVEHLQFAAAQSPRNPAVFVELATAYAAEQSWTAARRSAYAALDRDPRHVDALLLAADLAARAGDDSESAALYLRALRQEPQNSTARLGVALVHLRCDRLARAAPLLRAVGQDDHASASDRARAYRELGAALARENRWPEAASALAGVVQFQSQTTAEDWYRVAQAQHQLGDTAAVRSALTRSLLLDSGHAAALELAATLAPTPPPAASPILQAGYTTEASCPSSEAIGHSEP